MAAGLFGKKPRVRLVQGKRWADRIAKAQPFLHHNLISALGLWRGDRQLKELISKI